MRGNISRFLVPFLLLSLSLSLLFVTFVPFFTFLSKTDKSKKLWLLMVSSLFKYLLLKFYQFCSVCYCIFVCVFVIFYNCVYLQQKQKQKQKKQIKKKRKRVKCNDILIAVIVIVITFHVICFMAKLPFFCLWQHWII